MVTSSGGEVGRRALRARRCSRALPPMGSLGTGQHIRWGNILSRYVLNRTKSEQDGLCPQQREPASSELTALPIAPQHWASRCWLLGERLIGR